MRGRGRVGHRGSAPQAEEERDDMERVKLDNKRILFNLLPAHVAQHFLMSNPRNMVSLPCQAALAGVTGLRLEVPPRGTLPSCLCLKLQSMAISEPRMHQG